MRRCISWTIAIVFITQASRTHAQGLTETGAVTGSSPIPRTVEELAVDSRRQLLDRIADARRNAGMPPDPVHDRLPADQRNHVPTPTPGPDRVDVVSPRPAQPADLIGRPADVAGPTGLLPTVLQRRMELLAPGLSAGPQAGTGRMLEATRLRRPDVSTLFENGERSFLSERGLAVLPPRLQSRDDDIGHDIVGDDPVRRDDDRDPSRDTEPPVIDIVINTRDRLNDIEIDFDLTHDLAIIDEMRDRAIDTGDPDILIIADRMEDEARREHERRTGNDKTGGPGHKPPKPPLPPNGRR